MYTNISILLLEWLFNLQEWKTGFWVKDLQSTGLKNRNEGTKIHSPLLSFFWFRVLGIVSTSPGEMKGTATQSLIFSNLSWEERSSLSQARLKHSLRTWGWARGGRWMMCFGCGWGLDVGSDPPASGGTSSSVIPKPAQRDSMPSIHIILIYFVSSLSTHTMRSKLT